nr:hypothetical protein [Tanacetum cinerariifolium]
MPAFEDVSTFNFSSDNEDDGIVANMNNLDTTIQVSHIPTTRIHKDHPLDKVIGDLKTSIQTRKMSKNLEEHGFVSTIQQRTNHKDLQNACLLAFYHRKNPKRAIGTKWIFRNKKDKSGIMIRNKARLVAQGYTHEKWIDYDEVFAPVARTEAIRLFLAYAFFKDFVVYQMDVKSAFLYGKIEEEMHCMDYIKLLDPGMKACQHICWTMGFKKEKLTRPYSLKRHKGDILLVKVYVDDIIFGSTKKELCNAFERFTEVKNASTPMETQKPLLKDEDGEEVDVHMYRSMIGSLMYLTSLRPDIMFVVCACVRYQVNPKHTLSDYAGASLDKKFTTEGCRFRGYEEGIDGLPNSTNLEQLALMGPKTTAWNEFSSTMTSAIISLAIGQKFNFSKLIFDSMIRNLDNVSANKAVHKELGDSLVRAATTASSLEAEQDSGGGPRCQEAMGDTTDQTKFESISKHSNDSLLARGNTIQSDGDRMKLNKLMELCTNLQISVLHLEKTKTTQSNEIASLKRRVKRLKKKSRSRTHKLNRLYKVGLTAKVESSDEESLGEDASKQERRIDAIDQDEDITLEQEEPGKSTTTTISKKQSLDKGKGIMIEEPVKPKKKDQIRLDEEAAKSLQAEFNEKERLAREKAQKEQEAIIALIET